MEKRIKDILTEDELDKVHRLNKKIMKSSTNKEILDYKDEIDWIIKRAKERYFNL